MRTIHLFGLATIMLANCSTKASDIGREQEHAPTAYLAPEEVARTPRFAVAVDALPSMGQRDAPVTIVAFTDYDCVYCARAEHNIAALREKYGKDLRVFVAQRPLPMHPNARQAALAALSVAPRNFENFHKQLFANPNARTSSALVDLAVASGESGPAFEQALAGNASKEALARAEALAKALHVEGTPAFFINGRKIAGAQPLAAFDIVVTEEIAFAQSLVAKGTSRDHVYDAILELAKTNPAPLDAPKAPPPPQFSPEAINAGGAHLFGSPSAMTTITLFTDFECPFCQRLDGRLRELTEKRKDVRVVLRHKPLPMHASARLAAKAAIAAESFGKLEAYTSKLFTHQDALARDALVVYAQEVGINADAFVRALDSEATEARLVADEAVAAKLNVRATPTSFVGARLVEGAQSMATFEEALSRPTVNR